MPPLYDAKGQLHVYPRHSNSVELDSRCTNCGKHSAHSGHCAYVNPLDPIHLEYSSHRQREECADHPVYIHSENTTVSQDPANGEPAEGTTNEPVQVAGDASESPDTKE